MEETKQDVVLYKFHELIINQNQRSLSLCDFFNVSNFDPSQFFDLSFWCALNSLEDDEWFEVTDDTIQIIGYKSTEKRKDSGRGNLLKFIKKNFIENVDYKNSLHPRGWKPNDTGGRNKMTLEMKRDSFKMLLLTANTEHSKDIYRYLIAFENNVKQYAIYQHECQLYQKETQLNNTFQENARLKALSDVPTLEPYRKNALAINKQKRTVYVFTSKRYASLDLYKIGISFSPKKRKMNINTTHVLKDDEFYQVYSVECYDADIVEKYIHDTIDQYRYRKEREFFLLPLPLIKTVINSVASLFNDCYDRINDAIETWNKPTHITETHTLLLLPPPPLHEQKASTPTKTESNAPQQTSIPMELHVENLNMNSLDQLCTISEEHSLDIEIVHYLAIHTDSKIKQNVSIRENNISIHNIRRLENDLRARKSLTVKSKELLLEKIEMFCRYL